jgi:hypothetical protein
MWHCSSEIREGACKEANRGTGTYMIRVKVPDGVKLMPHPHSEDRIYTVFSGSF